MTNQELKELIIKFAKPLEASEMECIDDAICDAFRAQLNMQQPETILNHVHELEDKIKSLEEQLEVAQNKKPEIKLVEKEVIPTEVQDEIIALEDEVEELKNKIQDLEEVNDDLNSQIKNLESDLNDSMTIAETALNDVETLQARCTELYEQNEELLKVLNEEEVEEVTFEEPEEVSNEDILANSMNEEVDEEEVLKQMTESLDQLVIEDDNEKK